LKLHSVSNVRRTEIHKAEPDPGLSSFEVEVVIAKLKKYKLPDSDQILAEPIQAGGEPLLSEIHQLIHSIWNKEELPQQRNESIIVPIHKKGDKTNSNDIIGYHCYNLCTQFHYIDEIIGDHLCGFKHNRSTQQDANNQVYDY
jgi:hypothetical protein